MQKVLATLVLAGALSVPSFSIAWSAPVQHHPTYAIVKGHACKAGYAKKTLARDETKRVKVHGKWRTELVMKREVVKGKAKLVPVTVRYVGCVWKTAQTGLLTPAAPGSTKATATSSTSSSTGGARANIDPTYTQDPVNPLNVTFDFSASETDGSLPDGVLRFEWGPTQQSKTLACSINVGGATTGGQCTIPFPAYGPEYVTTTYLSGTNSATETDQVDIENPNPPTPTTVAGPAASSTALTISYRAGGSSASDQWHTYPDPSATVVSGGNTVTIPGGQLTFSLVDSSNGSTTATWTTTTGNPAGCAFSMLSEALSGQVPVAFIAFDSLNNTCTGPGHVDLSHADVEAGDYSFVATFSGTSSLLGSSSFPVATAVPS